MYKIYDPNTTFNKIFTFIGNSVTIGTGFLGIVSWIIKNSINNFSSINPIYATISTFILHFCIVAFIFGLICLIIRIVYVAFKSKAQSLYIQRKLTEFLHKQLVHKVRNNIVELEPLYEKIQKFSKTNNKDAILECYQTECEELKKNLKVYVDDLSQYLSKYQGSVISVCIKVFKERNRNREQFQSEEIVSLVRSSNTENERVNNDKTYVGQKYRFYKFV